MALRPHDATIKGYECHAAVDSCIFCHRDAWLAASSETCAIMGRQAQKLAKAIRLKGYKALEPTRPGKTRPAYWPYKAIRP